MHDGVLFVLLSGLTRIYHASDALATFALPLIQVLSIWLTKVALVAFLSDSIMASSCPAFCARRITPTARGLIGPPIHPIFIERN